MTEMERKIADISADEAAKLDPNRVMRPVPPVGKIGIKLYHWHVDRGGLKADYLTATYTLEGARAIMLEQLSIPGAAAYLAAGHADYITANDPFIADVDYPIVLF